MTITIAKQIDVSNYDTGDLIVRLHSVNWSSASGDDSFSVKVLQDGFTTDSPEISFIGNALATSIFTFVNGSYDAPAMDIQSLSTPFGALVMVQIIVDHNNADTVYNLELSIDLVMRD